MRNILPLVAVVVVFWAGAPSVAGNSLRCYTCVSMDNDLTCLNDPDSVTSSVPITECDMEGEVCCTIQRVNFIEDESKLQSFYRGCTDKCPKKDFEKVEDATYVTYTSACNTPECNVGPGDKPLAGNGGSQNAKSNEIWGIQGLSSSAAAQSVSLLVLLAALSLHLLRSN